jgi:hypothetical protein
MSSVIQQLVHGQKAHHHHHHPPPPYQMIHSVVQNTCAPLVGIKPIETIMACAAVKHVVFFSAQENHIQRPVIHILGTQELYV